jgi:glycosyltransferase involved in cell wall biosynthesis
MELYAVALYEAFRESPDFEPVLLARAGPPFTEPTGHHGPSPFAMVGNDPNQYLLYTDTFVDFSGWDPLFGRWANKQILTRFLTDFLLAHRPDIVHFQHVSYIGYDTLRVTRNALPDVPLVCSLHEYLPICHRDGQLVRTKNNDLCEKESPRRCHECFPEVAPQRFFLRKRFIRSHLDLADLFIVPSEYAAERYEDWGIPRSKIVVKPYPRPSLPNEVDQSERQESIKVRNRFGFFGQVNPYKGADVLLEAIESLGDDFDGELLMYGANLEIQPIEFRERIEALLGRNLKVSFMGPYNHEDLPKLMAGIDWVVVPSIWWETGPIVIWEAFQHGRPVICSDIGGMSEKVKHGVNGLHFRRANALELAETIRRAAETPDLWEALHANVPREPGHDIEEDAGLMSAIYKELLERRAESSGGRPLEEVSSA